MLVKRVEVGKDKVNIVFKVDSDPFDVGPKGGNLQHCWRRVNPSTATSDCAQETAESFDCGFIARLATRAKRMRSTFVSKRLSLRSSFRAEPIPTRSQIESKRYVQPTGLDEINEISCVTVASSTTPGSKNREMLFTKRARASRSSLSSLPNE